MKKPESFPFEHQANGMVFHIYSTPQVKVQKDGKQTTYDSFLLTYYEGGKRISKRRSMWEEIDALIEEVIVAHRKSDPERIELSGRDRRVYLAALEALAPIGGDVDQAVRDFVTAAQLLAPYKITVPQAAQMLADALKKLGKTSLSTAIDFYERHGQTMTATKTVQEAVRELIDELDKDRRGKYHIRDMKVRLGRFAEMFTGPIHEVPEKEITVWLQGLKKVVWKNGKQVENDRGILISERTRNNYRAAVCELFEFARIRGYIPKDMETEASATKRVKVIPGKNHIITPAEAKRGLTKLSAHLVPFTALKLFSGLRTEEAFGLQWDELRFKSQAVIIEAKLAKRAPGKAGVERQCGE